MTPTRIIQSLSKCSSNFVNRFSLLPIAADSITILTDANEFYRSLCDGIAATKSKILLSSLYFDSDAQSGRISELLAQKTGIEKKIFLLDAQRSIRISKGKHSLSSFPKELISNVHLLQTPSYWKTKFPNRINEMFGTHHMKLYIFDDTLLISGYLHNFPNLNLPFTLFFPPTSANLSKDYFTNRQDRYWAIKDAKVVDYFFELAELSCQFSYKCNDSFEVAKDGNSIEELKHNKMIDLPKDCPCPSTQSRSFANFASEKINEFLIKQNKNTTWDFKKLENYDTILIPTVQLGCVNIRVEEELLKSLIRQFATEEHSIKLSTPYFNVTNDLCNDICKSEAHWKVLTCAPQANGFYQSAGVSYYIPHAYLAQEKKFLTQVARSKANVKLYEWFKEKETFHAKGFWIANTKDQLPFISNCGSSNFSLYFNCNW